MEPSFSTMLQSPVTESNTPRSGMSATGTSHTYANLSMGLPPKAPAPYNVVSPPGYGDAPSRYANYIDPSNYSNMANYGNSSNYSSASNYSDLDNFNSAASEDHFVNEDCCPKYQRPKYKLSVNWYADSECIIANVKM